MFRVVVALLVSLSLVACTTMQAVQVTGKPQIRAAVKVGDEVSVSAVNGKTYLLVLTAVDDDKIVGEGDKQRVSIRYEQITALEVRKLSLGRTAGAVGATAVVIYATLLVLVIFAFKSFGEGIGGGS